MLLGFCQVQSQTLFKTGVFCAFDHRRHGIYQHVLGAPKYLQFMKKQVFKIFNFLHTLNFFD